MPDGGLGSSLDLRLSSLAGGQRKLETCVYLHPHRFRLSRCHDEPQGSGPCLVTLEGHGTSPIIRSFVHSLIHSWIYQAAGNVALCPHSSVQGAVSPLQALGQARPNLLWSCANEDSAPYPSALRAPGLNVSLLCQVDPSGLHPDPRVLCQADVHPAQSVACKENTTRTAAPPLWSHSTPSTSSHSKRLLGQPQFPHP